MDEMKKNQINVKLTYPNSDEFDFLTMIETINLDKEMQSDIDSGNGFLILAAKSTNKKDIKNPDGIYSPKFGQKLGDMNPFADRYSCECGNLKSRINHGIECPICHTKCIYVDDDFKMFGWIVLKDQYHILHPKFYDSLEYIFGSSPYNIERKRIKGSKLQNILNYSPEVDQDGHQSECAFKPDNEPFYGIGMIEFYNRFDEILDYYTKGQKKKDYFEDIEDHRYSCSCGLNMFPGRSTLDLERVKYRMKFQENKICTLCETPIKYIDKDIIFTHSIPVFTTHLRPADIRDNYMYYEPTNGIYNMINKHVHSINNDRRKLNQDVKIKNSELFKVQMKFQELVNEVINILSGKKGQLRMLIGGKMFAHYSSNAINANFSNCWEIL